MALDSVPAWLDVTPAQFGQAAAEGARLNLSRQELAQRGQEENAKLQMSAAASAAQLGMEQKRLAATEQQMAMQHQLREDMLASNFQRAQTQSAVARAYHEAMIGLGKQRLADTAAKTAQVHKEAAQALSDTQNFAMFIAGGGSIAEGLAKYPRANPRTVSLLERGTKPAPLSSDRDKIVHSNLTAAYKAALKTGDLQQAGTAAKQLREFDEKVYPQGLRQPPAATAGVAAPMPPAGPPSPQNFIGTPGGQNQFTGTPQNFVGTPGGQNQFVNPASTYRETQPVAANNAPKEIIRMTKDGKKAVFDADTKKFLRYAD